MNDRRDRTEGVRYLRLELAARRVNVPAARVRGYVQAGIVRPSRLDGDVAFFGEAELARLRRIRRMTDDLGLNAAGIEVAMRLLDEIDRLRAALEERGGRREA